MSNVETKHLFDGKWVRAEALADGTPLGRPIFLKAIKGNYLSREDVDQLCIELMRALALTSPPPSADS